MGSHYCHLNLDERRKLAKWLEARMPVSEIADRLGREASTIYRDIKRNRYTDTELPELNGYYALNAQDMYEKRRAIHRKMIVHPDLKAAIEDRLKAGWSPEQIAERMKLERHPIRVSHETIYRFRSWRHLSKVWLPYPLMRASRSPLIVAPSSRPGSISRPGSARTRGSVTRKRPTKRAPSRTRTTDCAVISPDQPNRALINRYFGSICHRLNSTPRKCLGRSPIETRFSE